MYTYTVYKDVCMYEDISNDVRICTFMIKKRLWQSVEKQITSNHTTSIDYIAYKMCLNTA